MHRLLLLLLLCLPPSALADPLTRAVQVRELSYEQSQEKLPVDLTATVGFIEGFGTVFVQDETAGTHLHLKPLRTDLKVGDRVRAEGVTMPGLYLPGVAVTRLIVLGQGPPPAPLRATYDDLASGRYHYQRVVVEGVGRRLTQVDENRSILHLMLGSRVIEVRLDVPAGTAPPDVVDARLRITALAAGGINDRRQLVFPYLRVTGWEDVTVMEPALPLSKLEIVPVANLLRFGAPADTSHRVRVSGVVLASFENGRVFMRDLHQGETNPKAGDEEVIIRAVSMQLVSPLALQPGTAIDAVGFPVMDRFSATLADAQVQRLETPLVEVRPVEVSAAALADGAFDADLVSLNARLVNAFRTTEGYDLRLDAGEVSLRALMPASAVLKELEPGSLLRLTGICQVESSTDKGFRSRADRAVLLLRTAEDLQVLQAPSWWTARRLAVALGVLGGLVVLGLIWIGLLRRQVTRQAAALSTGVAQKAALEERQRIAREFHDTLEQELAGLNLRLDAAVTRPLEAKARELLDTSRQLVQRVQAEARNLVADLRSDPEATADLAGALRELAGRVSQDDLMAVLVEIEGPIPPLPTHSVHHLKMIAQEAVTNAMKHAAARTITLGLRTTDGILHLTVSDDGRGLAESQTLGVPGHFGCMGIRERARKIGADVAWKSREGGGTCVEVELRLPTA